MAAVMAFGTIVPRATLDGMCQRAVMVRSRSVSGRLKDVNIHVKRDMEEPTAWRASTTSMRATVINEKRKTRR